MTATGSKKGICEAGRIMPRVDAHEGEAVRILRENGYFLGGLLVRWFHTDGMLMQKFLPPPCWEDIRIAFERDRFMVDTVRKDWDLRQHRDSLL